MREVNIATLLERVRQRLTVSLLKSQAVYQLERCHMFQLMLPHPYSSSRVQSVLHKLEVIMKFVLADQYVHLPDVLSLWAVPCVC